MKNRIIIVGILLFCMSNVFAQKRPKTDWQNQNIKSSGTYFDTQIRDKKWANINGKSYTSAKFNYLEGLTYAKLMVEKEMMLALDFDIEVLLGNLEAQLIDSNGEIIFKKNFDKSQKTTEKVTLKENEEYQLQFIGVEAKGSYFCQWKEIE